MTVRPRALFNRVFVKEEEMKAKFGLIIPKSAQGTKLYQGVVIDAGPDVDDVVTGDKVFWGKYAGGSQKIGEQEFIVLNDTDLIGRLEEVDD